MDDLFFQLVIYRDSDLPAKKLDLERDAGDYINVRVNGGANGLINSRTVRQEAVNHSGFRVERGDANPERN